MEYIINLDEKIKKELNKQEIKEIKHKVKTYLENTQKKSRPETNKSYEFDSPPLKLSCYIDNLEVFVSKIGNPDILPFFKYYARTRDMTEVQKKFYKKVKESLDSGIHIDVDGHISYLFSYAWDAILPLAPKDPLKTHFKLLELYELYSGEEQKFAQYCIHFSLESLLLAGEYKRYLSLTEPQIGSKIMWGDKNLRVNLLEDLKLPIDALDYVYCFGVPLPKTAKTHPPLFVDSLREIKKEDEKKNGDWLDRIKKYPDMKKTWDRIVFCGSEIERYLPFKIAMYYSAYGFYDVLKEKIRDSENDTRVKLGLPKIGEGWVSETKLYNLIKKELPYTPVIQHGRPDWLGKQHLDIWLPRWNIGIEYHGTQHFKPVDFFGGEEAFQETIKRDKRKETLCKENNTTLIIATEKDDFTDIIAKVKETIAIKINDEKK